ncbi:hypothetical protein CK203_071160 [Vitis vinifera]|uniref:Uncharacterized protein n=1 Tax=Vitis vinifera TaxID=29760 RepID=A0A438DSF5_VITVI|nr:hypothetical protein CK203_071160 [Vitis vinifera]
MVRIIPMATSFRPSLSSFGFSTSSRLGFPLSTFNISRTVTSLHVGSDDGFLLICLSVEVSLSLKSNTPRPTSLLSSGLV